MREVHFFKAYSVDHKPKSLLLSITVKYTAITGHRRRRVITACIRSLLLSITEASHFADPISIDALQSLSKNEFSV